MAPKQLRAALERLELTQTKASRLLGVTQSAMYRWLSGNRGIPGPVVAAISAWLRRPAVVVTFAGAARGVDGMPDPYNSYFVIASPWSRDHSIASIVPLAGDAPMPASMHLDFQGEPLDALKAAQKRLQRLPPNRKLKMQHEYRYIGHERAGEEK